MTSRRPAAVCSASSASRARALRIGTRRVEAEDDRCRVAFDQQRDPCRGAAHRAPPARCMMLRQEHGRFLQRGQPLPRRSGPATIADRDPVRRLLAEREAEGEREDQRKAEDPEERFASRARTPSSASTASSTIGGRMRVFSGIAKLPSGQRDEEILERRSVRRERHQLRACPLDRRDQLRHGLGQRIDAQQPAAFARASRRRTRRSPSTTLVRQRRLAGELDDVAARRASRSAPRACRGR